MSTKFWLAFIPRAKARVFSRSPFDKVSPVKRPLEKVFNDLIGIRIIVSDYSIWEGIRARFVSSEVTVVDLRQGKIPDDGYRAVHLYFQSDHRHYPVELQFVSEHDNVFNAWQHDHFYHKRVESPRSLDRGVRRAILHHNKIFLKQKHNYAIYMFGG